MAGEELVVFSSTRSGLSISHLFDWRKIQKHCLGVSFTPSYVVPLEILEITPKSARHRGTEVLCGFGMSEWVDAREGDSIEGKHTHTSKTQRQQNADRATRRDMFRSAAITTRWNWRLTRLTCLGRRNGFSLRRLDLYNVQFAIEKWLGNYYLDGFAVPTTVDGRNPANQLIW